MDHGMTCRTSKIIGAARCGKCGKSWSEMLPHYPSPPLGGGVVRQGMKRAVGG